MFIDYLKQHGVLNDKNYNSFKHFLDIDLKETLIRMKLVDESKIRFYWGEYIKGNGNKTK